MLEEALAVVEAGLAGGKVKDKLAALEQQGHRRLLVLTGEHPKGARGRGERGWVGGRGGVP